MLIKRANTLLSSVTAVGVSTSTSKGTPIVCGTNNTMTSWVQLVASTAAACFGFDVIIQTPTNSGTLWAMEIGIGGAGSEVVIAPTLAVSDDTNEGRFFCFRIPIAIPAGTRISARGQGSLADTAWASVLLYAGAPVEQSAVGVDCVGFVAATTTGALVTGSASINVKGVYSQITASTAHPYRGFFFTVLSDPATPASNSYALIDLAVGVTSAVTTPVASPGLVNWTAHRRSAGEAVKFTGAALPTGLVAGTEYYVIAAGLTANVFEVSATIGGAAVNFTGSSSGAQTCTAQLVIIPNYSVLTRNIVMVTPSPIYYLPIAASTLLSARLQANIASAKADICFYGIY
jgi:hypothetical protein